MSLKLECNSCGYAELVRDRLKSKCPECGSSDVFFETKTEASRQMDSKVVPNVNPKVHSKSVPRTVPKTPSRTGSGTWESMEKTTQARIIIGLMGFIFVLVGVVVIGSSFIGAITMLVIGFILLVIASKGEICCNC
jgi:predicted ATP-dependent serine protease